MTQRTQYLILAMCWWFSGFTAFLFGALWIYFHPDLPHINVVWIALACGFEAGVANFYAMQKAEHVPST